MAPSLHISAGPDAKALQPIAVNHDDNPLEINSPHFHGRATVRIKNFTGVDPPSVTHQSDSPYFNATHRKGITWSIQLQGRFLHEVNTDDVVFGNQFDKPIKDHLPYGTSVALQFAKIVDPNLQHDLYCDTPWAFSPLVATMTHFNVQRLEKEALSEKGGTAQEEFEAKGYPGFPSPQADGGKDTPAGKAGYVFDNTSALVENAARDDEGKRVLAEEFSSLMDNTTFLGLSWGSSDSDDKEDTDDAEALKARKRLFGDKKKRQAIKFTPEDVWTADFDNGFIDFNTLSLSLPYGGLQFDLKRYWDGQPVRYVCKNQKTGDIYFVVQFTIEDLDA